MIFFWGGLSISSLYCGTQQGVANLPSLPHFTVHFPQRLPLGSVSHSTPDVGSPPDLGSLQNNYARFHKQMPNTDCSDCESFFFLFFWFAFNVPRWLTRIYSLSPWSHCLIDRQGITYRQMSTVIANWPLIHVLNTMFCEEGRDYITAITFSSGSQCANRFCVFFSSFG